MWGHGLSTRPRRLWALAGAAALLGGTAGSWTQHHLPKDAVRLWVFVGIAYTFSRETRPSGFRTSEGEEMWATQQTRQGLRDWTLGRGEAGLPGLGGCAGWEPVGVNCERECVHPALSGDGCGGGEARGLSLFMVSQVPATHEVCVCCTHSQTHPTPTSSKTLCGLGLPLNLINEGLPG